MAPTEQKQYRELQSHNIKQIRVHVEFRLVFNDHPTWINRNVRLIEQRAPLEPSKINGNWTGRMRVNDLAVDNGELCAVRGAETHPFASRDTAVARKTPCALIISANKQHPFPSHPHAKRLSDSQCVYNTYTSHYKYRISSHKASHI